MCYSWDPPLPNKQTVLIQTIYIKKKSSPPVFNSAFLCRLFKGRKPKTKSALPALNSQPLSLGGGVSLLFRQGLWVERRSRTILHNPGGARAWVWMPASPRASVCPRWITKFSVLLYQGGSCHLVGLLWGLRKAWTIGSYKSWDKNYSFWSEYSAWPHHTEDNCWEGRGRGVPWVKVLHTGPSHWLLSAGPAKEPAS